MGNYIDDLKVFNPLLTVRQNSCRIRQVLWRNWLIEYNFNRPHQSLGYLTPTEFLEMKKEKNLAGKVLPMCPTRTKS